MSETLKPALPSWVRAIDVCALVFVLLGVSVIVTGGFREWTLIGRVSITSWHRPVAAGLLLLLLRHWFHREPSFPSRLVSSVRAWRQSVEARVVWPVFLTTRVGILVIAFLGVVLLGYAPNMPPYRISDNEFVNLASRWDTGWYINIADDGYAWDPARADQMQNIAYFPAYPTLIRYGSLLLARNRAWTGVLISFVAFFFALKYLFRLARGAIGEEAAPTAVTLLAAYPFAFFFSAAYTEALFLLTITAACYHFDRDELWKAAIWGVLAGLTRPNGCLLAVVLGLMALREYKATPGQWFAARAATAAMPAIGMLTFSAYIYLLTGNPLQWVNAHAAFGRVYRSLDPVVDRVHYIQVNGLYAYASVMTLDMLNAIPLFFALAMIWPVYRRFGLPYAAMIAVNVVPPALMGGVLSIGRITSVIFPLFLWLASAIPQRHRASWIMAFAMLQALAAITFFTWRPLV